MRQAERKKDMLLLSTLDMFTFISLVFPIVFIIKIKIFVSSHLTFYMPVIFALVICLKYPNR